MKKIISRIAWVQLVVILSCGFAYSNDFDVNSDGRVGLEEAIYSLQVASGLTPQPESTAGNCGVIKIALETGENPKPEISFHLFDTGASFLIIHGILIQTPTIEDPDYKPIIMSGTGQVAEITENSVVKSIFFMNLNYAQEHASCNRDSRIAQVSLDLSTLQGTFWAVGTDFCTDGDGSFDNSYDHFPISLVGELPACIQNGN